MAPPARPLPGSGTASRHVLVVLARNQPGVLNRVTSLMRARNFNIESLTASHTARPGISHMTITIWGDEVTVEQATKQLYKLIDVLKVQDLSDAPIVEFDLALLKVSAPPPARAEITAIAEMHRAMVVDVADASLILQAAGSVAEIDALISLLTPFGIKEVLRTGSVAMPRGNAVTREGE
jgi:acetolactate synthase-1/3 small subunit